jgi:cystathionine beta-lyase/cystathionine gamma-synthase
MVKQYEIETALVHAGEPEPRIGGAATLPIFQSSVFEYVEGGKHSDIAYPRLNNLPNQTALGRKLAALENGEAGLVLASGMAAIVTTLFTVLGKGDHLLIQDSLYGGTYSFVTKDLSSFGIGFDFVDADAPATWAGKLKPTTKAIYVEAITNPLMQVADHRAVVAFAQKTGLVSIIDNTFATPINFRPLVLGYDVSLHSCTKYLNGHSDLVAGAVIGGSPFIEKVTRRLNHLGACLDPHACFLLHRGIKTLALRVRQQNQSAMRLAQYLAKRKEVEKVNYPGLKTHPQHARAEELFDGYGGMMSFELKGGTEAAKAFIDNLCLALQAPSLGGLETLITRPATTSHSNISKKERDQLGIGDGLIRMSIGIENTDDLLGDFNQALDRLG